jgi:DNA repair protein RecN (Recombination protein N)
VSLARRYRRTPAELPALLAGWKAELAGAGCRSRSGRRWSRPPQRPRTTWRAGGASRLGTAQEGRAAPGAAVTQAMQQLGMAGGRFEVALLPQAEPQAYGLESVELRVAGHGGSTPRALAKVASGGELSRLALAIAVTTAQAAGPAAALRR